LLSIGHLELLVLNIEDGVDLAHEDVTHNQDFTELRREIETHDTEDALDVHVVDDVVRTLESELVTIEVDVEFRERGNLGAVNGVATREELSGANKIGDLGNDSGGGGKGRGTRVRDEADVGDESGGSKLEGVELAFPVGFVGERNGDEVASVVSRVVTAKVELTVDRGGVGEVEGELGLQAGVSSNEVLEDGDLTFNGDGGPSETHDTVPLADCVSGTEAGGVGDFSERLLRNGESADGDFIGGKVAGARSRAVFNLEDGAILLVGGGELLVVTGMEETGSDGASNSGNPEVRRSAVPQNLEILGGCADGNGTRKLQTHEVMNDDGIITEFFGELDHRFVLDGLGERAIALNRNRDSVDESDQANDNESESSDEDLHYLKKSFFVTEKKGGLNTLFPR
jgi:hypothetical protein